MLLKTSFKKYCILKSFYNSLIYFLALFLPESAQPESPRLDEVCFADRTVGKGLMISNLFNDYACKHALSHTVHCAVQYS